MIQRSDGYAYGIWMETEKVPIAKVSLFTDPEDRANESMCTELASKI